MRSSDQRYFHARRTKRETNLHPEVAEAISMAQADPSIAPVVYALVRQSAYEFTHIALICGRTANDFRRNFRRGAARHNIIPVADLVPHDVLLRHRLDGYVAIRLTREQYWNLKTRSGKLRPQDAVIHDPQGQWWSLLLHYKLGGPKPEQVQLLHDLKSWAVQLFDPDSEADFAKHVTKAMERHDRYIAKAMPDRPERTAEIYERVAQSSMNALERWMDLGIEAEGIPQLKGQVRLGIEKALVVLEAFIDGGDVKRAALDPDTSGRHCSKQELERRLMRVVTEYAGRITLSEEVEAA